MLKQRHLDMQRHATRGKRVRHMQREERESNKCNERKDRQSETERTRKSIDSGKCRDREVDRLTTVLAPLLLRVHFPLISLRASGLVSASVGGSAIEFWTSAKARADGSVKAGTCGGSTAKLADGCLQSVGPNMDDRTSQDEKTESSDVASGAACLPDDSICFQGSPFVCCSGTCSDDQHCVHTNSTTDAASQASGVAAVGQASGVAVGGWTPGCFFNAMISPFQYLVPVALTQRCTDSPLV